MSERFQFIDAMEASQALKDWLKSQDIEPPHAVITMEIFLAQMILANAKGPADIEEKIKLIQDSVRFYIEQFKEIRA